MPETHWTRPPWLRTRRQIRAGGLHLARVYYIRSAEETEANLCLMHAAPTMYAALGAALAALESVSGMEDHPATRSVRDALAKARGEGADDE